MRHSARGMPRATGSGVFHGHYGKVLLFVLSFFWWYVLSGLVSGLCWLIAMFGFVFIPGASGFVAFLLALAAGACLGVVINGFLAAYIPIPLLSACLNFTRAGHRMSVSLSSKGKNG